MLLIIVVFVIFYLLFVTITKNSIGHSIRHQNMVDNHNYNTMIKRLENFDYDNWHQQFIMNKKIIELKIVLDPYLISISDVLENSNMITLIITASLVDVAYILMRINTFDMRNRPFASFGITIVDISDNDIIKIKRRYIKELKQVKESARCALKKYRYDPLYSASYRSLKDNFNSIHDKVLLTVKNILQKK